MKFALKLCLFVFSLLIFACSDPCDDINCENGGNCDDGTCICVDGYSGDNCEIENRLAFIGSWSGTSMCPGEDPEDYAFIITPSIDAADAVLMSFDDGTEYIGIVTSPTEMNIPEDMFTDPIFGLEVTYSGDASLDANNTMTFNIDASIAGLGSNSCTATVNK